MVAVPEMRVSDPVVAPVGPPSVPVHGRRVVAVAVSPMELLRPASDLARLVEGFGHVDLLLAADDAPTAAPCAVGVLACAHGADAGDDPDGELDLDDWADEDWAEDDWAEDDGDPDQELREEVARMGLPGLHLHRLGLHLPLGPRAEDDLVAGMSELVGFDPEPGVYCLAPAPSPADPGRGAVERAAQRIAQVYGIPLLRYRTLELSVVGEDTP